MLTTGFVAQTQITGSVAANDALLVNTFGGDDRVTVTPGVSDLITPSSTEAHRRLAVVPIEFVPEADPPTGPSQSRSRCWTDASVPSGSSNALARDDQQKRNSARPVSAGA